MSDAQKPGEDELIASNPNATGPDGAAGDMGVSSEREGRTGPGQHGTNGGLDTSPGTAQVDADGVVPPEQSAGGDPDANPEPPGVPPKAGYSSRDPRSGGAPYQPGPEHSR